MRIDPVNGNPGSIPLYSKLKMKIHGEHRFQIVFILNFDEMPTGHSFGNRGPIQLYRNYSNGV